MNQIDQNINKDMIDSDLIDVDSLVFSDDQTWLYTLPDDSGNPVDIVDWNLSCDWPINEDDEYHKDETKIYELLDAILKNQVLSMPDKHKFDSRTYVKPKRRSQRPSIQSIVEATSNPPSLTNTNTSGNKYLTYNKYSMPLGPVSPMLRLKTFNVDTNTDNSNVIKEYAMKRRSLVNDEDPQLEDPDVTLVSENSQRLSPEHLPSKPINIDLSQPAHNLHNTFNKGLPSILSERGSLNMYQSGESLMRMSPPSLVSSLLMESSGNFHMESLDAKKSFISQKTDSGFPLSGRDSIDPMMTSMTLSILDEKDMNTSFLSQTTYPDNDSLMDSLPPSLVSSVNSSFVVSNTSKPKTDNGELNVFGSPTYTNLEQSEKLLPGRPRLNMYNSYTKRDVPLKKSESYTKSREESCQIDAQKILNENNDMKETSRKSSTEMSETITIHTNNRFRHTHAEKENRNATFEKNDAFFKDMGMITDLGKNSLNVTLDKQELNEIIQARQKLSLARKALPTEPDKSLPNQVDTTTNNIIRLPNQTIIVPKQSMENASELLSRRKAMNSNGYDKHEEPTRDAPKRNATFKKPSPTKNSAMDTTVVYVKTDDNRMIDINSATMNLIDSGDRTVQQDQWSGERAMVGSSESTDTATFSSSSPPDSVPDTTLTDPRVQVASTPLLRGRNKEDLMKLHTTISPIYDIVDDKSYTVTRVPKSNSVDGAHNTTINSATISKKMIPKRDILVQRNSPDKKSLGPSAQQRMSSPSAGFMVAPSAVVRRTGLPTSKLRQYSSHKELSRIPGSAGASGGAVRGGLGGAGVAAGAMARRGVYASNPALSPTAPHPPAHPTVPLPRRDSYVIVDGQGSKEENEVGAAPPPLVRQGTETLRRERPLSQLVAPKDVRAGTGPAARTHMQAPSSRPYCTGGPQTTRPTSVPTQKPPPVSSESRPSSALPRPSRLPAPRRALRPPSVYSVAQTGDVEHY